MNICERILSVFQEVKNDIYMGRWEGITENAITLSSDASKDSINIVVKFTDRNRHTHICSLQYNPDLKTISEPSEDAAILSYEFNGMFAKDQKKRSFSKYLSCFHNDIWDCGMKIRGNKFTRLIELNHALVNFRYLIDTVCSLIKPMDWFSLSSLKFHYVRELKKYILEVFERIREEAKDGRWRGLAEKNFFIMEDKEPFNELSLNLLLHFDRTFEIKFNLIVNWYRTQNNVNIQLWGRRGMFLASPIDSYSNEILEKIFQLFEGFFDELNSRNKDRTIWSNNGGIYVTPPLEEAFDYYCRILDDLMETLHNFKFQIPVPVSDNEPSDMIKETVQLLEESLNTTFEIVPELSEEQEVNERLKRIYVWTEEPSRRVKNVGISNCASLLNHDGN